MSDFERMNELLSYDPETGVLSWRVDRRANVKAGDEAGGVAIDCRNSYRRIRVGIKKYLGHRIAWLLVTGDWPAGQIDHIDGNGQNNQFSNLRVVTDKENLKNKRQYLNNTSGITGVFWRERDQKWKAHIRVERKLVHLGSFDCLEDAIDARKTANSAYGFSDRHGLVE